MATPRDRFARRAANRICRALVLVLAIAIATTVGPSHWLDRGSATVPAANEPTHNAPSPKSLAWGIGPANAHKIDGRPDFKWFVSPGAVVHDHVGIENFSKKPLTLALYARDATNAANGQLGLQPQAATPRDAGAWITLGLPHHGHVLRVPARSRAIVAVQVHVPRHATPGDHTAGIISSLSAAVKTRKGLKVNPKLEQRVAVPVAIRVSGPVHPQLQVEGLHTSYSATLDPIGKGSATISYRVVNTGNVNLGARQLVTVSSWIGSTVKVAASNVPALLPGNSASITVHAQDVTPAIFDHSHVVLTPLIPEGDVDPGAEPASASATFLAIPWILLALILVVVAAAVFAVRRRRNVRRGTRVATGPASAGTT